MTAVTDCLDCPLRCKPLFVPMSEDELAFMRRFKTGETEVPQGRDVMSQGRKSPILQTVLSGMAVRSVLLEDGRRQVINFLPSFPDRVQAAGAPPSCMPQQRKDANLSQ